MTDENNWGEDINTMKQKSVEQNLNYMKKKFIQLVSKLRNVFKKSKYSSRVDDLSQILKCTPLKARGFFPLQLSFIGGKDVQICPLSTDVYFPKAHSLRRVRD